MILTVTMMNIMIIVDYDNGVIIRDDVECDTILILSAYNSFYYGSGLELVTSSKSHRRIEFCA